MVSRNVRRILVCSLSTVFSAKTVAGDSSESDCINYCQINCQKISSMYDFSSCRAAVSANQQYDFLGNSKVSIAPSSTPMFGSAGEDDNINRERIHPSLYEQVIGWYRAQYVNKVQTIGHLESVFVEQRATRRTVSFNGQNTPSNLPSEAWNEKDPPLYEDVMKMTEMKYYQRCDNCQQANKYRV